MPKHVIEHTIPGIDQVGAADLQAVAGRLSRVSEAQAHLRAQYKETPQLAMVTDQAVTCGDDPSDPFHSMVRPMGSSGVAVPVGVHRAVGGPYDAPCPGDLLCAALAACQDSTVRMVANLMGIELVALEVQVRAAVDVRGALGIHKDVPVGFQSISCDIHLQAREGTPPDLLEKLRMAAQRSCVVGQTLLSPPSIQTTFHTAPVAHTHLDWSASKPPATH